MFLLLFLQGARPIKRHTVKFQGEGIAVMSWSPDDSLLVICGRDDNSDAMIYSVEVNAYLQQYECTFV